MIVDCHVHLNNYADEPVTLEERYARLLAQMEKHALDHVLVISSCVANEKRPPTRTTSRRR